ncbi:aldo/keto reductase [uncultured Enterovirga sp.]|uniref:aldo/keto reductase n=1 Tax=uncultured Enterovirga sp. TaxID=2026352 RepID=UPI0035CC7945
MTDRHDSGADRRKVLGGIALGAVAAASSRPAFAQAQTPPAAGMQARPASAEPAATKPAGRTGETLTRLGLGTYLTFDLLPGANRDRLREVTRIHVEAGARVVDTSPLYGTGEASVGQFLSAMGATDQMFVANKIWSTGDFLADESHAMRSFEQSQLRLWRQRFDLIQVHSLVNVDVVVPMLQAWKKEGRTRFVGVTHHDNDYHEVLASWVARGAVDFVQVNYSIANRGAEQRVLRAALDRGVGVFINMPLDKGRLHKLVGDRPLPDFAREFGAENWAQFFLKFAMSHPAVTTVLCGTSDPAHAAENVGALRGPLPDEAMRSRMVRHMEGIPGFDTIGRAPWYPDKQALYQGVIRRSQAGMRQRLS